MITNTIHTDPMIEELPFSAAQIELLNAMAWLKTDEELIALRHAISEFFADRADQEMDRLWNEGILNDEIVEGWKNEHMRTPYHCQCSLYR